MARRGASLGYFERTADPGDARRKVVVEAAAGREVLGLSAEINRYDIDLGAPFGGMKDSGIGRELGPEGINKYLEYKSIYAPVNRLRG